MIYSSVADANKKTGIPHFESKHLVEKHVAGLGIPYTISAPASFMENIVAPWSIGALRQGTYASAMPPKRVLPATCACDRCRGGDLVNCRNQEFTGIQHDGGYAEVLIAKASGLMSIPDDLAAADAAPLLCAGLTTFSALRNAPAKAGDLVAVLGIGGLGHLGVQYARHMGLEVVAIGRGADKAELARKLGAHHYIDSSSVDPGQALLELGGAALVLATASAGHAVAQTLKGLRSGGKVIALGATPDPIEVSMSDLLFGSRSIEGAQTGDPRHRRRDAEVQCADRGRGNDRDQRRSAHAAWRGRFRQSRRLDSRRHAASSRDDVGVRSRCEARELWDAVASDLANGRAF